MNKQSPKDRKRNFLKIQSAEVNMVFHKQNSLLAQKS
jgi:hypothetical protein